MFRMAKINQRNERILRLLVDGQEYRFKVFMDHNVIARSTLAEHLNEIRKEKLIRKKYSDNANATIYLITSKGRHLLKRIDEELIQKRTAWLKGRMGRLLDFT